MFGLLFGLDHEAAGQYVLEPAMKRPAKKPRARDLTIYLLREGVSPDDAIENRAGLQSFTVAVGKQEAELLVGQTKRHPPRWADFFSSQIEPKNFGLVSAVSAVLLLTVAGRLHALTFGHGRFLLKPDSWEERFGFRVALNSVDPRKVLSVDKQTLDSLGRHTRIQASRAATVPEFGIDYEQDLLRAVVGKPSDEKLGVRMTGTDSLRTTVGADLATLPALLTRYSERAGDQGYKKHYPWIDHISALSDKALITDLEAEIVGRLGAKKAEGLSLAVPTIVDWGSFEAFRYEGIGDSVHHNELVLGDLVQLFDENGRSWVPEDLRTVRVATVQPDGLILDKWPLHQCLFGEMPWKGKTYVLSAGQWYQVSKSFAADVQEAFASVPRLTPALLPYADADEQAYCKRLGASDAAWTVMDRKPISYGGARSLVEFCDLFSLASKTLLHVKRYAGSAPLSHLFAQALVSGETFHLEPEFRIRVNKKLPDSHKLSDCAARLDGYRIVLGIVKAGNLDLPFFSKVTLRNAFKRLRGFGFDVQLAHIDIDMSLIRFGGHFLKGGYDVQNGIKEDGTATAAAVHGRVHGGGGPAGVG